MRNLWVLVSLLSLTFHPFAFGQSETSTVIDRGLRNGGRYAFQDSRGGEWLYRANSNGGYDVYDGRHRKVATVTATFE